MHVCYKYAVKATTVFSSLRQVTMHVLKVKPRKICRQVFSKQSEAYEYKIEMAEMQAMTDAFIHAAIEATRTVVKTITDKADPAEGSARRNETGLKIGGLQLKQPTFNWPAKNKHDELRNFKIEVKYFFMTKHHDIADVKMWAKKFMQMRLPFYTNTNNRRARNVQKQCRIIPNLK